MRSNADLERQELRRIEFGVVRLIFSTTTATRRLAERLKYGAMAMAMAMAIAIAIAAGARRHGAMRATTLIRDTRSQSGA